MCDHTHTQAYFADYMLSVKKTKTCGITVWQKKNKKNHLRYQEVEIPVWKTCRTFLSSEAVNSNNSAVSNVTPLSHTHSRAQRQSHPHSLTLHEKTLVYIVILLTQPPFVVHSPLTVFLWFLSLFYFQIIFIIFCSFIPLFYSFSASTVKLIDGINYYATRAWLVIFDFLTKISIISWHITQLGIYNWVIIENKRNAFPLLSRTFFLQIQPFNRPCGQQQNTD